ncbi:translation initiation factor eIF-2B subunit delta isoform X2 [Amborella trichopoda]|uniref:translation initiation factor eIF-2B subunit delta isoform X2 n=1 Tax=Amborella trichopoda TaxID=13333 RepID=UPI0009BE1C00|nr:translation initiation factor eIF-2B subunit delta isoform X2 [Amborella trichopoda]|eukprot:XP_020521878.1 translation initiation factor eIF-2B subunit delta isoform X2 [Amborella trichopoda]
MDARRVSRMVIDPKVRQVGFVTPGASSEPMKHIIESSSMASSSSELTPSGNSLSPVMIPPPRHAIPVPVPSPLRRPSIGDNMPLGSYNPSDSLLGASPTISPSSRNDDDNPYSGIPSVDLSDEFSPRWIDRTNSGTISNTKADDFGHKLPQLASSFPFSSNLTAVSMVKMPLPRRGEVETNHSMSSKPLKEKTSKAERRALQEAQRAAKAASKETGGDKQAVAFGEGANPNAKQAKSAKPPPQKKDGAPGASSGATSEKKGVDRPPEKERKKDVPAPRMQFDDTQRVEKAKRRALVKPTETMNRVELFRHLPQYVHGAQLPALESKFFEVDQMHPHPAVYRVGLQYLTGDISGGNARCVAMLMAFQEAIKDYTIPLEKVLIRDLTAKINSYVSFLITCRPLSISMGNAIKFLKARIAKLSVTLSESEAKAALQSDISRFINEKIVLADKVIVRHAVTKIRDGDVLLTYGSSCVVEMILCYAHELGKQFRVVVVDSRPKLEGQALLRRLLAKGLSCTYIHINAISYIMHEVTRVFLGASSVLSNGTVYSRVGTACVAMVAHAFHVPVLICCEAYKFHERVQLDSICSNELGDPDALSKVHGRKDLNHLENWANNEKLQLLNLTYDATPSDYVSMIVTDYGMVPPTSVPVIVREYLREHLLI